MSARRALAATGYTERGDRWLAELVLDGCDALGAGAAPDDAVSAALAAAAGEGIGADDEEILAEVLTVGLSQVCPDAVLTAGGLGGGAEGADAFLATVSPVVVAAGLSEPLGDAALLEAGLTGCRVLDGGGTVTDAATALLGVLFGVSGGDLAALEEAGLDETAGTVGGTVLGAAGAHLCPQHAASIAEFAAGSGS